MGGVVSRANSNNNSNNNSFRVPPLPSCKDIMPVLETGMDLSANNANCDRAARLAASQTHAVGNGSDCPPVLVKKKNQSTINCSNFVPPFGTPCMGRLGTITGEEGLEPPTPRFVAACSNPLSYTPFSPIQGPPAFLPAGLEGVSQFVNYIIC